MVQITSMVSPYNIVLVVPNNDVVPTVKDQATPIGQSWLMLINQTKPNQTKSNQCRTSSTLLHSGLIQTSQVNKSGYSAPPENSIPSFNSHDLSKSPSAQGQYYQYQHSPGASINKKPRKRMIDSFFFNGDSIHI
jgi:hypothetical protein